MTTRPSLSPAQRNALWRATVGQPPSKDHRTMQALHRKGLLQGIDHRPTDAGAAYFASPATSAAPPTQRHTSELPRARTT
jgi:hypothetical protein